MTTEATSKPATPQATTRDIEVSVVIPVFDEHETLDAMFQGVHAALRNRSLEIIFVDDGSRDGSWKEVCRLAAAHPGLVRGIRHRRNFGKAEALATGFAQARGEIVATMDADLQDDPTELPAMIAKLDEGFDLISGWKRDRHDPISKTIPSRFFNFAARAVSGLPLHDFNCGLKVYRREVTDDLNLYGELHRFTPILAHAEGYRVAELPVTHHAREYGKSKYGWKRFVKGFLDLMTIVLLTRYLKRPGHFFGAIGILCGGTGTAILGYLSVMKLFFGEDIGMRPLFFLGMILVLFGGQLISTGIIGEFLLRHSGEKGVRPSSKKCENGLQALD
ncbi:glycosyltransferase family 2 protein [Pelagicoccus sp. SDUM812003]|uniref:glycosyltransferase family 2 protein n=1 Tax=Pelagicoccus sp. SDUM812003 TaxID=3041267 RepID=UPI00281014B4|nr:glycosyltransferase family 2 protein [Pelagicoccus sp. SDUM812003]MDQ8202376.1 glycosyltransferase family 2 protein [Pelagicoccus sp. SDUM812003]